MNNDLEIFKVISNKEKELTNTHFPSCRYIDRSIPTDICNCNCYNRRLFELDKQKTQKLFHSPDKRYK